MAEDREHNEGSGSGEENRRGGEKQMWRREVFTYQELSVYAHPRFTSATSPPIHVPQALPSPTPQVPLALLPPRLLTCHQTPLLKRQQPSPLSKPTSHPLIMEVPTANSPSW